MEPTPTPEGSEDTGARRMWRRWRERPLTGLLGGDLALAVLLVAGCGLLAFAMTGAGGSAAGGGDGDGGNAVGAESDRALEFAECMRENGVPGFPDPVDGRIMIRPDNGLDPASPEFQEARDACQEHAPEGLGPGGAADPELQERVLAFAECMRENGVPDFPDPDTSGGGVRITPGESGFDPSSPEFEAAQEQCSEHLEGFGGGMRRGTP